MANETRCEACGKWNEAGVSCTHIDGAIWRKPAARVVAECRTCADKENPASGVSVYLSSDNAIAHRAAEHDVREITR